MRTPPGRTRLPVTGVRVAGPLQPAVAQLWVCGHGPSARFGKGAGPSGLPGGPVGHPGWSTLPERTRPSSVRMTSSTGVKWSCACTRSTSRRSVCGRCRAGPRRPREGVAGVSGRVHVVDGGPTGMLTGQYEAAATGAEQFARHRRRNHRHGRGGAAGIAARPREGAEDPPAGPPHARRPGSVAPSGMAPGAGSLTCGPVRPDSVQRARTPRTGVAVRRLCRGPGSKANSAVRTVRSPVAPRPRDVVRTRPRSARARREKSYSTL